MTDGNTPSQPCEHPVPPVEPSERAEWFALMIRTHSVARCPVCELNRVWLPK